MRLDPNVREISGDSVCWSGLVGSESSGVELVLTSLLGGNCLRCGFICTGYQQLNRLPHIEKKKAPVPLLPRSEYKSPGYAQSSVGLRGKYGYRTEHFHVDPQHGSSPGMEDDSAGRSVMPRVLAGSSENHRLPAISVYQTATSASNRAHPGQQLKNAYECAGPLHDLSRHETSQDLEGGTLQSA